MAASYPTSTKSFTTKTDGPAQTIFASYVNDLQDEVVAIENGLRTGLSHDLTVNGKIVFPGTQVPSSGANTLDDYEEFTWTPVIGGSGGTSGQSYTTQSGLYVKIGKIVIAQFNILFSAKGTITTDVQIQGLPFTIENTSGYGPALIISQFAGLAVNWISLGGFGVVNTTTAAVTGTKAAAAASAALATADIGNTTQLIGQIIYRATA